MKESKETSGVMLLGLILIAISIFTGASVYFFAQVYQRQDNTEEQNVILGTEVEEALKDCVSITYSEWSLCDDNLQIRYLVNAFPAGCKIEVSNLTRSCITSQ